MKIRKCAEDFTYRLYDDELGYDVVFKDKGQYEAKSGACWVRLPEDNPLARKLFNVKLFDDTRDEVEITEKGSHKYSSGAPRDIPVRKTPEERLAWVTDYLDEGDKQVFFDLVRRAMLKKSEADAILQKRKLIEAKEAQVAKYIAELEVLRASLVK